MPPRRLTRPTAAAARDDHPGPDTGSHPSSGRAATSSALWMMAAVAGVALLSDQLTKAWALSALELGAPRRALVGDLLGLQLTHNSGAALSMGAGMTWVLTIVAVGVVVVVARMARQVSSRLWAVTFGLLLGGALGNLVDRMVRDPGPFRGEVVDFIKYGNWFIGNVADIAIVVAALAVMVLVAVGLRLDGTRPLPGEPTPDGDAPEATSISSGSVPLPDEPKADADAPDPAGPGTDDSDSTAPGTSGQAPSGQEGTGKDSAGQTSATDA